MRQRRRKALAAIAILLGTTAVTAMLALATTIGDRIHRELAVYGANIVVYPKADTLDVKVGGVDLKPATGGAYLKESDLEKLKGIFWANNITGVSPEFIKDGRITHFDWMGDAKASWLPDKDASQSQLPPSIPVTLVGYWFDHPFGAIRTGAPALHPWWKLQGSWPSDKSAVLSGNAVTEDVVVGSNVARQFNLRIGDQIVIRVEHLGKITGIVSSGDSTDDAVLYALDALTPMMRSIQGSREQQTWSPEVT